LGGRRGDPTTAGAFSLRGGRASQFLDPGAALLDPLVSGGELWVHCPDGRDLLAVGAFDLDQAGLQLMGAGEFRRRRFRQVAVDGVR
jgi:hypothetical protein